MELRVLKYFITIANEQNISRAAQIIHITQPTLSRQIIELEEELGVTLFERAGSSIRLTRNGELYQDCFNEIGDDVFDLASEQFGGERLCYEGNPEQSREVHFAKEEKRLRYEYLRSELLKRLR